MTLLPADLSKIDAIFKMKDWKRTDDDLFNNICSAVELLDKKEKDLFFFLTSKFLRIYDIDYFPKIGKAIEQLNIPQNTKQIIIVPLLREKDFDRIKSSCMFVYPLKQQLKQIFHIKQPIYTFSNYRSISRPINEHTLFIIPDDFIGSGTSAREFIEELRSKYGNVNIAFVTIASLETGENLLESLNCEVYSCHHLKKGIQDDETIDDDKKSEYYKILHNLSERLGILPQYEKGLYDSEALISLLKIPNNTFGLYWCVSKKGEKLKWPQMFQRF